MDEAIYPVIGKNSSNLILATGIGRCDNQYHCLRKEGYPHPQINICIHGEGVLITEGRTFPIKEGMSFFLPPDIPHEYYGLSEKWSLKWVTFSGSGWGELSSQFAMTGCLVTKHNDLTEINLAWQGIYNALRGSGENSLYRADSYMYRFLTEYHISRIDSEEKPRESSAFRLAQEYIEHHFMEEITISEIASAAGITPQYLCRVFSKRTGMRPFQYISSRRIQYAKTLLAPGKISVSEAARLSGYNDTSYFCKCFKRQEGISPAKFMSCGR